MHYCLSTTGLFIARACLLSACLFVAPAQGQVGTAPQAATAPHGGTPDYKIELDVDYRAATFVGRETVTVVNTARREVDSLSFFLYPNVGQGEQAEDEAAYLSVRQVSLGGRELRFSLKAHSTVVQVELPAKLAPGESVQLTLDFAARVPRLQREETTLLAHFLHEASDAVSSERQRRDARDIFFAAEQAMLLGYFFPMLGPPDALAANHGLAFGVGGIVFSEAANYEVTVSADSYLTVIGSAPAEARLSTAATGTPQAVRSSHVFRGHNLRGFALALGENLRPLEKQMGTTRVVSYFEPGNERLSRQMLDVTARALGVYASAFGEYDTPQVNIVELPLPAGYSGIEFPGLIALAQAYCIDFESPQSSRLPGLVREQADVITSALEFTLAHCLAHQWWGNVVGSDPQRYPYLDEALANFAAVYFFEAAYGAAAGQEAIDKHLHATYQVYRSLGGTDTEMDKPARDFRSAMQYAAIVQAKGAMMMVALRKQLGDAAFFKALRGYYSEFRFKFATPRDLREAFLAVSDAPAATRAIFNRYTKEKRGDQDIGTPDIMLLTTQGSKARKLGRFFGRIGRAAARPF